MRKVIEETILSVTLSHPEKAPAILRIEPGKQSDMIAGVNHYEAEAEKIYGFLLSLFCLKTLSELKKRLPDIER